jgi:hypothetical protein
MRSVAGSVWVCIAGALLLASTARADAQSQRRSSSLRGDLEHGAYEIGFRLFTDYDIDRPALPSSISTNVGRQIPIAIWYPAIRSTQAHMRLRDYVRASGEAIVGEPAAGASSLSRFVDDAAARGVGRPAVETLLKAETSAMRNAELVPKRFPLVLFAHASPETESVMCEYLASHGFVVAAVKSRGATEPDYRLSRENLDAMVSDLAFVAARMEREPNVAGGGVSVIGMSNGSIAGVGLQLRGLRVSAVVSLDGGIGEDAGGTFLKERAAGDLSRFSSPILHLYAPNNRHLNLDHLRSYHALPADTGVCPRDAPSGFSCVSDVRSRGRRIFRERLSGRDRGIRMGESIYVAISKGQSRAGEGQRRVARQSARVTRRTAGFADGGAASCSGASAVGRPIATLEGADPVGEKREQSQ